MKIMPELNIELCDGCGLCVVACHGGGIIKDKDKVIIVESENCDFCAVCEAVCPHSAIHCYFAILSKKD